LRRMGSMEPELVVALAEPKQAGGTQYHGVCPLDILTP